MKRKKEEAFLSVEEVIQSKRGTSIYFADKVVPMLPPALSNGICSLYSGVDRYALSVLMELDKFGEIKKITPKKTIIRSCVRGVYSEVNDIIEGIADAEILGKYDVILPETLELAHLNVISISKTLTFFVNHLIFQHFAACIHLIVL